MKKTKICIVGPGIVGKATGRALQDKGFEIGFIGRSPEQIEKLKSEGYTAYGRKDLMQGDYDYDITIFTVPTPTNNGKINLDAMELAAIDLGKRLKNTKNYHVFVIKSTSPPGTTENMVIPIIEEYSGKKVGKDFGACMNPEYLREMSAYEDSIAPWVTVIGEYDRKSGDTLVKVYEAFDCPIYRCTLQEAEMQKYIHNLYNAAKITFFNEMRAVAKELGIDAEKVFKYTALSCEGMWNANYGIKDRGAYSGACLPKDVKAFLHFAKRKGLDVTMLQTVSTVNETFKEKTVVLSLNGHKTNGESTHFKHLELLREVEQNTDTTL